MMGGQRFEVEGSVNRKVVTLGVESKLLKTGLRKDYLEIEDQDYLPNDKQTSPYDTAT